MDLNSGGIVTVVGKGSQVIASVTDLDSEATIVTMYLLSMSCSYPLPLPSDSKG
jgi:hypothetical protein